MNLAMISSRFRRQPKSEETEKEVLSLVWSTIDGDADEVDIARLKQLVESQQSARQAYEDAVEMDKTLRLILG